MTWSFSGRIRRLSLLPWVLLWAACVSKTDFYGGLEPGGGAGVVSVQYLKSLYRGYALPLEDDLEVHGVIVANDLYGSFPYTLVIEDDSGGIEVKASGERLFVGFPVGQQVMIRCQGLVLGSYGGVVQLGAASSDPAYQTGWISRDELSFRINKTGRPIVTVFPETVSIGELTPIHVGKLVAFERVQFAEEERSLGWCHGEEATTRHLVDAGGNRLEVRTLPGALFAGQTLPDGSGYIEGILSYFNDAYQLRVFSPKNVLLTGPRF